MAAYWAVFDHSRRLLLRGPGTYMFPYETVVVYFTLPSAAAPARSQLKLASDWRHLSRIACSSNVHLDEGVDSRRNISKKHERRLFWLACPVVSSFSFCFDVFWQIVLGYEHNNIRYQLWGLLIQGPALICATGRSKFFFLNENHCYLCYPEMRLSAGKWYHVSLAACAYCHVFRSEWMKPVIWGVHIHSHVKH